MEHINLNTFSIKEEMGFGNMQMKQLLLDVPKLWMMSKQYTHLYSDKTVFLINI